MTDLKKGDNVRLKVCVPEGAVEKFTMTEDGTVLCFISWKDLNGHSHQRWFPKEDLEKV